ncbi:RING finger protein 223 [Corythoichthys intestinalis]|uniref:RING finger protein 223 n=1 Tax=Corythoichthys intestinalis TaxID=161448 RepID=UPI0025A65296|nr:RING finger protein 223 [Corythoichthys intestinalis]
MHGDHQKGGEVNVKAQDLAAMNPSSSSPDSNAEPYFSVTVDERPPTSPRPCPFAGGDNLALPSPVLHPCSLSSSPLSDNDAPNLECWVCYSHYNNVFRCPKMLECKHTFCLECLARINVKSARPAAIRCPLCRHVTMLPASGLTKLATDAQVLASLPAAMQRAYSVRFHRGKGKLQIKRVTEGQVEFGESSLNISLPDVPLQNNGALGGAGEALFRLTGRPVCQALLLTVVLLMSVVLAGIIFLLTFDFNKF